MNSTPSLKDSIHPSYLIFRFNFIVSVLWGISLLLEKVGIPYFTPIFGLITLLTPGLCVALLLEQLSEIKIRPILLFIWSVILSFTVTSAAVYGISAFIFRRPPVNELTYPFLVWWAVILIITMLIATFKRQPSTMSDLQLDRVTNRELKYVIGAYLLIMGINFIVYPLLPEGDGYAYLISWRDTQTNPALFFSETRPLFLIFVSLCAQILHVAPYGIFKLLLPLSSVILILSCYIFTRNFITDSRYRILLSLSPLVFPVVLQESLISRPQSLILASFIPCLVLISEVMSNRRNLRGVYWLVALCVIGSLGIKVHTLFALIALVSLLSVAIFMWPYIAKRPIDSFIISVGLLILISPELSKARIIPDSWHVIQLFIESFRLKQFDWWFIDHYRNIDGIELGWPGYLSLFYYGYNLGLGFVPILLILIFQRRIRSLKSIIKTRYWAMIFLFFFFFFVAEIAPRFKIAYLPDRAWLFISLLLALALPVIVAGIKNNRRYLIFIALLYLLSIASGTALTYAKQGWVTPEEVKVAPFIKDKIPENALILSQGGTRMMVRFYTERAAIRPDYEAIYLTGEREALDVYLRNEESAYWEAQFIMQNRITEIDKTLTNLYRREGKLELNTQERGRLLESLLIINDQEKNHDENMKRLNELYPTVGRPIYIIYNENKFNSLYGTRSWWRTSQFYGANVKRLNANYPVIYNKNGITIWEARK